MVTKVTQFNTEITLIYGIVTTLLWYWDHSVMVLRPLKYGATTILTYNFPKVENYLKHIYSIKIILNYEGTFIIPKMEIWS